MIGLALSLACLASSYLVQRRTPAHRPVTVALGVQATVAALCLAPLPARVQMAGCALLPVVSACMYLRAWRFPLDGCGVAALAVVAFVTLTPDPLTWWGGLLPSLYVGTVTVGALAAWTWREGYGPPGITQRVAAVSLVGDLCMLLLMFARELAPWQSRLVAVALLVVHVRWLVADRALRRSLSAK